MSLANRSIISVDDMSKEEIETIFLLANRIHEDLPSFWGAGSGKVLATLFYEPSTRTRLSFESAIQRLGGGSISAWDMAASSAAKGETLLDTCRVVSTYADALVLRHPLEGSAQIIAEKVKVPVINAGDGGHEHPTQTLCDLYTMWLKHGHLDGLKVALCGDLKFGRTIHSLVYALARFRANIILLHGAKRELPEHVKRKLQRDYSVEVMPLQDIGPLQMLYPEGAPSELVNGGVDIIYMTPSKPHEPALYTKGGLRFNFDGVQLYLTRAQKERWEDPDDEASSYYPRVTKDILSRPEFRSTSILHPLPRVDEISTEIDDDERSLYFDQAANGVPIRMALLLAVLGLQELPGSPRQDEPSDFPLHTNTRGSGCGNAACITKEETTVARSFRIFPDRKGYWLRCYYCDHDFLATIYGNTQSNVYHEVRQLSREQPLREHVAFFRSEEEAVRAGFVKVSDNTRRAPNPRGIWPSMPSGKK